MFDKKEVKESLSVDDVADILSGFGAHCQVVSDGELLIETICHHEPGEGSHKLHYYDNTKLFNCYTSCGSFDIFDLVMNLFLRKGKDMDLDDAIRYIVDSQGFLQFTSEESIIETRANVRKEYVKPNIQEYHSKLFEQLRLKPDPGWVKEGISEETQRKYEVKRSSISEAIIFPHYDENHRLVGIRQRNLLPQAIEAYGKYRPATLAGEMYTSPLSFYLFGLDKNKAAIQRNKKAIVFESEKSVMKLDSSINPFYNNSVASFGMSFSYYQFRLLKDLGVEEIIIAFDRQFESASGKDPEYVRYAKKLMSIAERYGDEGVTISFTVDNEGKLDYKDSPIDKGILVFNELLENRFTLREEEENEV